MPLINTGCGIEGMRGLAPGSVDLVFCDLPSGETRAPFDKPISLPDFWDVVWPCLKSDGAVVLMASSLRFAAEVIGSQPKWYRYDLIWEKTNAAGFLNAGRQPLRAHEFLLLFYRELGTYNRQLTPGRRIRVSRDKGHGGKNYGRFVKQDYDSDMRVPRSVLRTTVAEKGGSAERRHPQQKPIPLLQWVVRTYTNEGETIVDPCAGSGSMGAAALGLKRQFIGWDFEPKPPTAVDVGLFG